jgi:mono/diheme cytochrome c family protein/glucose/arabinose dehydrogenase
MRNLPCLSSLLIAVATAWSSRLAAAENPEAPNESYHVPYLTPEQEAGTFVLPPGYHLELVLSDPIIKEPVVGMFDGNGRLFVAEMRSYMQNIDGQGEHNPVGRISLHWSSKGDGVYDRHTVFADHLVLPRMILPLADGLVVNETDSNDLWLYRDTNGDGVADEKTLFYKGGPRGGNLEHQQSGLVWGQDNWMYMAVNAYRLRVHGTNVVREPTAPNGGQWGINQDDYGKMWFVNAGGEIGPLNFQQPIVYGAFRIDGQLAPGFEEVWPIAGVADYQGGLMRVRKSNQTLNHFTATCGDEIYRGDRLPPDLKGDLLFAEPVGRLIRRAKIEVKDGVTYLRNAYDHSEFLRSTDLNFRPVNMMTAPDGNLYIVDMYRGIIQESAWVAPKSHLRPVVQKYHLDDNFGRGRIWRLVHDGFTPGPQPHMLDETPAQLVRHLDHPNGWWRDSAQKLLVLRGDKSIVPELLRMARTDPNTLARIHAIWTLEGLGALTPDFVREKLKDSNPHVRIAAIRASETLYKQGDSSLVPDIEALTKDSDPESVIQVMMTANLLKWPGAASLIQTTMAHNPSRGVQEIGSQLLRNDPVMAGYTSAEVRLLQQGKAIYGGLCFACHGVDGKGMPLTGGAPGATIAPPLQGSATVGGYHDGIISVVLKGLTGPVGGKSYSAVMVPMESNDDEWIAAVTSYVRASFGGHASLVSPKEVADVRARLRSHPQPWTEDELQAVLPQPIHNRSAWTVTASHHPEAARLAIDGKEETRYDTAATQVPGMWFQVELPEPVDLCGVQLDAGNDQHDYPRGYTVELSDNGRDWGSAVAEGRGRGPFIEIRFAPAHARFVRIVQTRSAANYYWSIHELQILASPKANLGNPSGTSTLPGVALFSFADIADLARFAARLRHPSDQDGVSNYLRSRLSPASLKALTGYTSGSNPQLQSALVDDLNHVLQGRSIYETQRFAGVALSKDTSTLLAGTAQTTISGQSASAHPASSSPAAAALLNRRLLLDAYPREIANRPIASAFE